jgi:hypothetical protein
VAHVRTRTGRRFYSADVAVQVIEQVESGRSLTEITRDPTMPTFKTVYLWLDADPALKARYDAARGKTKREGA